MFKRVSSFILLICLIAGMLPIEADAATEGYYTYSVSNGEATITGVSTSISGAITIPSTLGGYPVTSIGDDAFFGCSSLQSITIGDSVTHIREYAFRSCSSLTSVTIPDSVTSIGNYAFYNCSSLTSITIPNSVTSIGDCAFESCESLTGIWVDEKNQFYSSDNSGVLFNKDKTTLLYAPGAISGSYTIPDSVTTIREKAFQYRASLTSVTIPDSVTTIENYAFNNCSSLTSVTIPDSVTNIGCFVFFGSNLSFNILGYGRYLGNAENPYYALVDTTASSEITSFSFSNTTKIISGSAFYNCTSLTSVTIPDSVATIEDYTFCGCTSLTSMTIPDSVTSIGNDALYNCTSLTSVTIPDSVTSIGYYAFYNCSSLISVTIPDSVTSIGSFAFYNCSSLTGIWVDEKNQFYSSDNCGVLFNKDKTTLLHAPGAISGSYTIPESVTIIEHSAFYNCISLTSVTIGDSVTSIGDSTFRDCTSLTSITIPDSVTSIDARAFYKCTSLVSVTYCGTEEQWNQINIGFNNSALTNAERNYHNWQDATCTVPKTCAACGSTDGDALEHSYDTEILIKPTLTITGQQQKVCSVCGDTVIETLDMLVGEVSGWNVTLQDDLQVNFHLNISASIESTARVRIVVGEEGHTFRVSGLEKTEDGLYIASVNIAAAQMTDFIFVTVINGGDLAKTASYTVRGYADTILADESFSEYHTLVKEMLNYGAAAQLYFDYEEENLANEGVADAGSAEIPDSVDSELSVTGNAEGVTFYGASLIFRNKIAVRYYFQFKGDINDCSFTVNDTTYAPQLKDGLYYVEIADILPQDLDEEITLTVTDANGGSLAVCYNPMNYIVRMNEKGSEALQNLVKALYNYHLAAKSLVITEDPPANEDVIPDDTGTEDVSPDDTWWTETEDDMVEEDELLPPEW